MNKYSKFYKEWIDKYKDGLGCPEIANEYNCSVTAVQLVIRKAGVGRSNRGAQVLLSKHGQSYDDWVDEYKNGMSTLDIASKYGTSPAVVGRVVKRAGIIRTNSESQHLRDREYTCYHKVWIEEYIDGSSLRDIAEKYGCSVPRIASVVNIAGVMRSKREAGSLDSKYKKFYGEWVDKYISGMSARKIASGYGCDGMTVSSVIKKGGIARSVLETHNMKYGKFDTYFDNINSEGPAYFLGLLLADGSIRRVSGQHVLSLQLQICDGYMVERLAKILGRNCYMCPPRGRSKSSVSVHAHSDHLVNTLISYGFTFNKSLDDHNAIGFDHVPEHLMNHFIRGIIDGDGSIFIPKKGCPGISVVGNYNDLQAASNTISNIGCSVKVPRKDGSIYHVNWAARNDVTRIIHYLYSDATIYLDRKKQKADAIINMYNNK
jgi:Mor family transcriptional regulator